MIYSYVCTSRMMCIVHTIYMYMNTTLDTYNRGEIKQAAVPHITEEGGPRSRRVAAAAERPTGTATHGPCVLQPGCYACGQDGAHPRQPLACSRGKDSTARSILICFTEYTQSFPCVYTHRSHKYTHRSKCIHIHTVVYTHYHCVYTHRHTPEYTHSVSMYTHPYK